MSDISLELSRFLWSKDIDLIHIEDDKDIIKLKQYISDVLKIDTSVYSKDSPLLSLILDRLMMLAIRNDIPLDQSDNDNLHLLSIIDLRDKELKYIIKQLFKFADSFDAHLSAQINGLDIKITYKQGKAIKVVSKYLDDVTDLVIPYLENINKDFVDLLEPCDEVIIKGTIGIIQKELRSIDLNMAANMGIIVLELLQQQQYNVLGLVVYDYVDEGFTLATMQEIYDYLGDDLGFEVPISWVISDLTKDNFLNELQGIIADCELELTPNKEQNIEGYPYCTKGMVFLLDDLQFRNVMTSFSNYRTDGFSLNLNYWHNDVQEAIIQTIYWKSTVDKLVPYAIIGYEMDMIEYTENISSSYITDLSVIDNIDALGVYDAYDLKVLEIPLYDAKNLIILDAYENMSIKFRILDVNNVIPCDNEGNPLLVDALEFSLEA